MKKILITDDAAFSRMMLKQMLASEPYQIIEAGCGAEALALYESEKPDVVTLDLLMPDMDGIDVLKKIREINPDAKVIMCSTDKQKFRQNEAKEAGAVAFIPKPVDPEKLLSVLEELLSR